MIDKSPLLRFRIPPEFVEASGFPTAAELAYGYEAGWISAPDVVAVALAKYERGPKLRSEERDLAFLLSDRLDDLPKLIDALAVNDQPVESRARYWLFLALSFLLLHEDLVEDQYQAINLLYADFGSPSAIEDLVSYIAPFAGADPARPAIRSRWEEFVRAEAEEYRSRFPPRSVETGSDEAGDFAW